MSLQHSPKIIRDNLVLYLDPGNARCYSGTGSTCEDITGNNITCDLNSITYSSTNGGIFTTSGSFGSDITTPRITGTGTGTLSQTYCVWVNPNDTAGNILSMSSSNPQGGWNMPPIFASSGYFRVKFWANNVLSADTTYSNGTWYYVSAVFYYDTTAANRYQRLYVNGVQQAEQTGISYSSSGVNNYIYFGQQNPGANNTGMFAGSYGPMQIYTGKALTTTEIVDNFEAHRGRFGV